MLGDSFPHLWGGPVFFGERVNLTDGGFFERGGGYSLLYEAFPHFYSAYEKLPALLKKRLEDIHMHYVSTLRQLLLATSSHNDYFVQKWVKVSGVSCPSCIDEDGAMRWSDNAAVSLSAKDAMGFLAGETFYRLEIRQPTVGVSSRLVKVLLFTPRNHYIWEENLAQEVLVTFKAPAAVEQQATGESDDSTSSMPLVINWSEPFPGTATSIEPSRQPAVSAVQGRSDAKHVLVHFGEGNEVDEQFRNEHLPSIIDKAEPQGGLLYIFVRYQGKQPEMLKSFGIRFLPGFMLDGAVLVNCRSLDDVAEAVLSRITP